MVREAAAVVVIISLMIFLAVPVWGYDIKPGQYEITSKVEMPGLPPDLVPAQTITQCLTEEEPVPSKGDGGEDCRITEMNQKGNTITWQMQCNQMGEKLTSYGQMTYEGSGFSGQTTTRMGAQGNDMVITTRITGKRLGDCR